MGREDIVASLVQELRRGSIVMLVLSRLGKPKYGYNLIKELEQFGIMVEANTLYPLMRRLESQGLLESVWDTAESKPRKYYVITGEGKEVLSAVKGYWSNSVTAINKLLEEEDS